jgi:predicted Zn-ribbon and HTH transcriptional regulator
MMDDPDNFLERIWDALLSREPAQIRDAYASLNLEEQKAVLDHLKRMKDEPGWHLQQRISAQTALEVLASDSKQV